MGTGIRLGVVLPGEEVVAVTDECVLWFQDELEAVPLDAVEEEPIAGIEGAIGDGTVATDDAGRDVCEE